jgi:2,4-dienoyl-CoA reductase-like NADH-dependent reductase (Old Yellow Enzyme family)
MTELFPHLFEPISLRHKTLKNRIVFGAHTVNMSLDGTPSDRHFGYYRERARGGAAMIVVEPVPAHRTGILIRANFRTQDDSTIPHFRRITDECHSHGTVMIHQIYHVGQHGDQDHSWEPYWSPSGLPSFHDQHGSHAMTEAEIEEMIESFVAQAKREQAAGFDGVDLFAAYNCLIDQFWSPITNKRDDRWGGSLENRVRFAAEICRRIRKAVGEDFIIGMTVSGAEPAPGGLRIEDKQEVAAWLDARGLVDYFSVGTGSYLNEFNKIVPPFMFDMMMGPPDAAKYKEAVKHARVTSEARVKTPANAEKVIASGMADMVSLVRAQIADPHLANKARDGRPEDVRPCISCNQLCIGRRMRETWVSCLANPATGREFEWGGDIVPHSDRPRHVLVVGGGPAGLEVARVAAERGHRVTLVERDGELGGQFRLAAGQPLRGEINQLIGDWYPRQLEKLQVRIKLRTEMSADDIRAFGADAVVLCTGSEPAGDGYQRALPDVERLPGVDDANVCSVHDVLAGRIVPGTNVLLLDDLNGWWPASGTALHLAKQRHRVTLVTASELPAMALANSQTDYETRRLFVEWGVEAVCATALLSWRENVARLRNLMSGEEEERSFDTLVLATTNRPLDRLVGELAGSGLEVHAVGDNVAARTAAIAFYEARRLAMTL